jgi:hypothetical protein
LTIATGGEEMETMVAFGQPLEPYRRFALGMLFVHPVKQRQLQLQRVDQFDPVPTPFKFANDEF